MVYRGEYPFVRVDGLRPDCLRKSILIDSGADLLIYGMGEKPITELCKRMKESKDSQDGAHLPLQKDIPHDIPQTAPESIRIDLRRQSCQ